MKQFEIKITGSGTREQLEEALENIIHVLNDQTIPIEDYEGEDETLMTEITETYPLAFIKSRGESFYIENSKEELIGSGFLTLEGASRWCIDNDYEPII